MSRFSPRQWAVLMLLLANLFWGLSFPTIKAITLLHAQLLPEAGTWFSAVYTVAPRFVLAAGLMLLWQRTRLLSVTKLELRQGALIGVFAASGMLLQNDGLQFTTASTSAFLTQLYAVMIPVWIAFHRRHNPGWRIWTACALVLVGVAILGQFNPGALVGQGSLRFGRGELETLLSSFFFMGQILCLEKREFRSNRPEQITFVMFCTEAVIFSVLAVCTTPDVATLLLPWTHVGWLVLTLILTFLCTIGAFSLMNAWQPKISATEAGLIYCIEPIFGSLMALFIPAWFAVLAGIHYPNERVTWTLLAGGGLITLANLLVQVKTIRDPGSEIRGEN